MNVVDALVGERIRTRRRQIGMSQSDLGQAIGVRFQQVQKYETGSNRVSASRLWQIAEALSVEVVFFFEGISAPQDDATRVEDRLPARSDPAALELLDRFTRLPEGRKTAVLNIIRCMTDDPTAPPQTLEAFAD